MPLAALAKCLNGLTTHFLSTRNTVSTSVCVWTGAGSRVVAEEVCYGGSHEPARPRSAAHVFDSASNPRFFFHFFVVMTDTLLAGSAHPDGKSNNTNIWLCGCNCAMWLTCIAIDRRLRCVGPKGFRHSGAPTHETTRLREQFAWSDSVMLTRSAAVGSRYRIFCRRFAPGRGAGHNPVLLARVVAACLVALSNMY